MHNPHISLVMPVYNVEQYLKDSIESVLGQTYENFELIIVNDRSTDTSKDIALEYSLKDSRIVVVDNDGNKGLPGAINAGLRKAQGEFIARIDGDDICRPDRLETQLAYLNRHPDIDIVGGGYELFGNCPRKKIFHPSESIILHWKFITNTYFCHPTVMFRKEVLETVPEYPEKACEDFIFFSRALRVHKGYNIPKILIDYRQHGNNYSVTMTPAIVESVKETFEENFMWYIGSLKDSEVFYIFHGKYDLPLSSLSTVWRLSMRIAQRIREIHKVYFLETKAVALYATIITHIILAVTLHYGKTLYRKIR